MLNVAYSFLGIMSIFHISMFNMKLNPVGLAHYKDLKMCNCSRCYAQKWFIIHTSAGLFLEQRKSLPEVSQVAWQPHDNDKKDRARLPVCPCFGSFFNAKLTSCS